MEVDGAGRHLPGKKTFQICIKFLLIFFLGTAVGVHSVRMLFQIIIDSKADDQKRRAKAQQERQLEKFSFFHGRDELRFCLSYVRGKENMFLIRQLIWKMIYPDPGGRLWDTPFLFSETAAYR